MLAGGLFVIDAVAHRGGGRAAVAVHIDGPTHFLAAADRAAARRGAAGDGARSLVATGPAAARDRALRAMGWPLVVVPFFVWDGLRSARRRREWLAAALDAA